MRATDVNTIDGRLRAELEARRDELRPPEVVMAPAMLDQIDHLTTSP